METRPNSDPARRDVLSALAGWSLKLALGGGAGLGLTVSASVAEDQAKKKGGGLSYIQLQPLNAALSPFRGRRQILSIECGLDVPDGGLRTRAQQSRLILRDAYLRWITIYAASLPAQAPPDPDAIVAELQRETDRILGRPGAHFLLGTVMVN